MDRAFRAPKPLLRVAESALPDVDVAKRYERRTDDAVRVPAVRSRDPDRLQSTLAGMRQRAPPGCYGEVGETLRLEIGPSSRARQLEPLFKVLLSFRELC